MESFVQWETFITPKVIKILYWIAMVAVFVAGVVMLIGGLFKTQFALSLVGIGYIVLGPIVVRIYAELILLGFKILEVITEIRDKDAAPPAA